MSPYGQIYTPDQVDDLKKNAPKFADSLTPLSDNEAELLMKMNSQVQALELKRHRDGDDE